MSTSSTEQPIAAPPKGWVKAIPLEHYSSLNELSLLDLMGIHIPWPQKHFFVQFCFNLHTPLKIYPQAYLTFNTRDSALPPAIPNPCYSIGNINRWRLDMTPYHSLENFIANTPRQQRCCFARSKKTFFNYGCEITLHENDWSEYAEQVYRLYGNVAQRHGDWLYDLNFFQMIAKRPDYKILCAWFNGEMIAVFILQEELPTLHSIACGMDYNHSSASYAYSWMHYALIEKLIAAQKYQNIDIGLTADDAKKCIGFKAIPSNMDIYSNGFVTRKLLGSVSRFVSTTITSGPKLRFDWRKST
jgi:hypothetical protein